MKYSDMKQAVKLLSKEWNLGKKECGANNNICAWIYLMEVLEETEHFVYYRENGKLLGFAGYSNKNSKKKRFQKKFYTFIKNRLYKSKSIKDINALQEYEDNYDYMPEELKNKYDGEVSMLILDSSLRGKGIGKKMLSEVFKLDLVIVGDCVLNGINRIEDTLIHALYPTGHKHRSFKKLLRCW